MKRDDLLDLNDVLQHPGRVLAVDIDTELESQSDIDLLEPVAGFLEAVSTGNLLLLTGEFQTKANLDCARCAGPLRLDISFAIDEQIPVVGVPSSYGTQDFAKVGLALRLVPAALAPFVRCCAFCWLLASKKHSNEQNGQHASVLPGMRAMRVEPMKTLRED